MPRQIDYFFSMSSPWAYIGHPLFMEMARRHGVSANYKPVALGNVFAETGGLPLPKRHPVRQRYRMLELQRWREKRGLKFHLKPKYPPNAEFADRIVLAILAAGRDPDAFMRRAFAALWENEENIADEATMIRLADEAGLDGKAILAASKEDSTKATYERNFKDALAHDVFGSPGYVLDGEMFWGQDRLELLDDALKSARAPYRPEV